jgi:hypothetical protein
MSSSQAVDETSADYFLSAVSTNKRKKVMQNFLRSSKGFPCTISKWAPDGGGPKHKVLDTVFSINV